MVKPWIKRTVLGAIGGLFVLGSLAACAHHRGPMDETQISAMRGKAVERISGKLDLNETQKAKLGALADEMLAQRQALRAGTEPRAEMQALIAGNQFDRAKAQALLEQKTQAVQGGGPKVIAAMADFYDSLNADQQAKVRAFMAEHRHGGWGRG
jgi:Spy/CpxP family protein refolding chaperone